MRRVFPLIKALIQVIAVFGLAALAFRIVFGSPLGTWEHQALKRSFLEYLAVMAVPLACLSWPDETSLWSTEYLVIRWRLMVTIAVLIHSGGGRQPALFGTHRRRLKQRNSASRSERIARAFAICASVIVSWSHCAVKKSVSRGMWRV